MQSAVAETLPARGYGVVNLTPRLFFIVLGVVAALAIIVFSTQSLLLERRHLIEQREAQAATLAQAASTYSSRLYDQSSRVAADVAQYVRENAPSDTALQAYLQERAEDSSADDYIVVLGPDGQVRANSGEKQLPRLNYQTSDIAARWSATSQEIVPVIRSRLTGAVIYSLSQRIDDQGGRFAGVVGVNFRPANIQPTARRRPDQPLLSVWDDRGRFIAASFVDFTAEGAAIPPPQPHGVGVQGSPPEKEGSAIVASSPVEGWPLVAVASFDKRGVLADWRRGVYEAIALLALTMAGIAALVWLGVKTADRETNAKAALQQSNALAQAALRDRDLLLKEVHHRVKNSLLMTASLLYLQERRFNDPDVREAFASTRRRLSSIGLVHEALYSGSSLEEVDLADYLGRLLSELADAYGAEARGISLVTEVEPLLLRADQTTPVGLIVAEVVTNAFKHAFPEGRGGEVSVRVRKLGLDEIEVEVRDDGPGFKPDNDDASHGLGTRLIAALTDQLRGQVDRSQQGGAVFRLTFARLSG